MKKLISLLIFSTTLVVQTEIGNFKVIDGEIIWQKRYDEDLPKNFHHKNHGKGFYLEHL
ncbi:hypothetical protein N9848_03060 [Flavobacteriaceae bacterium]|nr:hypothetical protein [Flavobacteriaceae bacterium]